MPEEFTFPIDAYLERIGYCGSVDASEQTLCAIHRAQICGIPFENLDQMAKRPILLAPESLVDKLITRRRGGYCFELNGLFLLALRSIGFKTRPLAARVLLADGTYSARGHQLTGIEIQGRKWIADVGYGGNGLIEAIPLEPGIETDQTLDRFRVSLDEDFGFRLEHALDGGWRTLYAFSLDPYSSLDYRTMNYFSSQSPDSIFTRIPFCTLPTGEERRILFGNTLKIRTPKKQTVIPVETTEALRETLKEWFELSFPDDFPLPHPQAPPSNR